MSGFVRDVILRDGTTLRLRSPGADETPQIAEFFDSLAPQSHYMRFRGHKGTEPVARACAEADGDTRMALVARHGERIVAVASYDCLREPGAAEVAFAVADEHQGRGAATRMLEQLAEHAAANGIERFDAEVLAENVAMLRVFRSAGFDVRREGSGGELRLSLDVRPSEQQYERRAERDHEATVASLEPVLAPRSVAVVGASDRADSVGGQIFKNIRQAGFTGVVTPVNRFADAVQEVRCVASIGEITDPVDLAVIAVGASQVLEATKEAAEAGVRAVIVVSTGFSDTEGGEALEAELMECVRAYGLRLLGPNSLGAVNTADSVRLRATIGSVPIQPGQIALSAQSGAIGIALLGHAAGRGLGISSFVSLGNRPDISTNDLLEYWSNDPDTAVVVLYVESFGNPRRFGQLSRRVSQRKPILAMKGKRRRAWPKRMRSHTAAALDTEAAADALLRQAGILRVDTTEELFDAAEFLERQGLSQGRNVAVLTNSGGLGTLATDACQGHGLAVPDLGEATRARLTEALRAFDRIANPIDMSIHATGADYAAALEAVLADERVDSALCVYVDLSGGDPCGVVDAIEAVADRHPKPVACSVVGADGLVPSGTDHHVPNFRFAEACAAVLSLSADRRSWLSRPLGQRPVVAGTDSAGARRVVADFLQNQGPGWLAGEQVDSLLASFGIAQAKTVRCGDVEQAVEAAELVAGPVVLKAVLAAWLHPADIDCVLVGLEGDAAVRAGWDELARRAQSAGYSFDQVAVQPLLEVGADILVGSVTDADLGPVVGVGTGGRQARLATDVGFTLAPLTDVDAQELVASSAAVSTWTQQFGTGLNLDRSQLTDTVVRLGRLVEEVPQLVEVDLNPVRVLRQGASVLDARMRVDHTQRSGRVKTW